MTNLITKICSNKRRYPTREDALAHRGDTWQSSGIPRAYHCQFCDGFHCTSHGRQAKQRTR
jgi:hypothetical protein